MILLGAVPIDWNGVLDFYDIRKGTNGPIPLDTYEIRT